MVEIRKLSKNSNFFLFIIILLIFLLSNTINYNYQILNNISAESNWTQNTKNDFLNGTINNVTITPNGEIELGIQTDYIADNFTDEFKINYKKNVVLDTKIGEVKLFRINTTLGGYYNEFVGSIKQTLDGGYLIVGETSLYGTDSDVWLIKLDNFGNIKWQKTYGGNDRDVGYYINDTSDGGYIIVGITEPLNNGDFDICLIKINESGNEQWQKIHGGNDDDSSYYVQQSSDGSYLIIGNTKSYGAGGYDIWLIKTDNLGNEQWNKTFGGIDGDFCYSAQQTSDGGFIISGITESFSVGESDTWLIKVDKFGNMEWNNTYGGIKNDLGQSCQQTSDHGFIIGGQTDSYGAGEFDVWLIKTDSLGNEQWNKTLGGEKTELSHGIQQTLDGGYVIVGERDYNIWLIKTNNLGIIQWDKILFKNFESYGREVRQTIDDGYIIGGDIFSFENGYDICFIKTDNLGNVNPVGSLLSNNLLQGLKIISINSFNYTAFIPPDTKIRVQFSQDNLSWYDSKGSFNKWDTLVDKTNSIDISLLNWTTPYFYYKLELTSNNEDLPAIQNISVVYAECYLNSGYFESKPFYSDSNVSWKVLKWQAIEPQQTNIKFQLKTAGSQNDLLTENFVGPDGKASTFYSKPNELIWSGHDYDNWIQFKAYLSTNNISQTPILEEVSISLNYLPNPPILNEPKNQSLITNKRPVFNWIFDDFESNQQLGFQWQMDDAVNFSSINFDSGEISSEQTSYTPTLQIPDGVWYWRVRTQDHDGDWGTFSDYFGVIIDTTIDSPVNLTISPDNWTAINSFTVSWENPFDPAGIAGAYYKLDTPPGANDDGIYFPGIEINTINGISVSNDGEHTIYIWLRDNLDNVNYNNHSSVVFYLDSSAPLSPNNITVAPNNWTSINSFSINWSNPMELSGTKNGAYYYIGLDFPNSQSDGTWAPDKPMIINHTMEGEYHLYLWLEDHLGNKNFENYGIVVLKLDTISPKITHTPVNNGVDREEIMITTEVTDEHSGINDVILHFKKPNDSSYNTISMNKNESIYSAIIPKDDVTANGLEYYIKAFDRSSPNNVIYYGKNGEAEVEPTSENDIDIIISGQEKHTQIQMDMMIYGIAGLVIIIIVTLIIIFLVIRGKKKQRSPQPTMNAPKQPVEMKIPISPEQKSITPKTAIEQQPQQPYFAPQQTQRTFTCERCGTIINDPNKCQYCGWTRQF